VKENAYLVTNISDLSKCSTVRFFVFIFFIFVIVVAGVFVGHDNAIHPSDLKKY